MTDPLILMSAPNGARRGKTDHPRIPLTPAELASCAADVANAGASMIHLHVRDGSGGHSIDPDRYRAAIAAVTERVGRKLVIQVTTEACGMYSPQQQMSAIRDLQPEAVSLAVKELCPDEHHEREAAAFFQELQGAGVMMQFILYSPAEVHRFEDLRQRGIVPGTRPFVLFVLGRYSESLTGEPAQLAPFVAALRDGVSWMVCCFGATEHQAVLVAAESGGHARVGFENNLVLPDGDPAPDNAALVHLAAASATAAGRRIASADDVRELLA